MSITEVNGDLFQANENSALAHCIAKDLGMGKGIASIFKKKYKGLDELRLQDGHVGGGAFLDREQRRIYYLITKNKSREFPTLDNLKKSLEWMRDNAIENNIITISMPRIGSGLDKLKWSDVLNEINNVFKDTNINIVIYYL